MKRRQAFYVNSLHYRLEMVRCGRPACRRCPHGPYWYCYDHRTGCQLKKRYVGKHLPAEILALAPKWVRDMADA
jgi:hypothetical protein